MISRRTILFALPSFAFLSQAQSATDKTVRVAFHPNVPPFSFQTKDLSGVKGILPDLIDTLATPTELSFSHQAFPWKRAQWMVETGAVDAFCCPTTPERASYAIFSPTPVITLHDPVFFYNPASPNAEAVKTAKHKSDFYKLSTASFLGNSSHDQIWSDHPLTEKVADINQILRMLAAGRIDFYFADPLVTGYKIKEAGLSGTLDSAPLGHLISKGQGTEMLFGLRRSYPNAEMLIEQIDIKLKQIITPEVRAQIVRKYVS